MRNKSENTEGNGRSNEVEHESTNFESCEISVEEYSHCDFEKLTFFRFFFQSDFLTIMYALKSKELFNLL